MLPSAGAATGPVRVGQLQCPNGVSLYEGPSSNAAKCTICSRKRIEHKLPSVTAPACMLRPVERISPPPPSTPPQWRPMPFKGWNESVDSEGAPLGMYRNDVRCQSEKPELPLPFGWMAVLDPARNTFYNHAASSTSQWDEPLPLHWKARKNPDGVPFFVREVAGLPEAAQSERPLTFMFCPNNGHPLLSYCDR